jgi:hypothetical protein
MHDAAGPAIAEDLHALRAEHLEAAKERVGGGAVAAQPAGATDPEEGVGGAVAAALADEVVQHLGPKPVVGEPVVGGEWA